MDKTRIKVMVADGNVEMLKVVSTFLSQNFCQVAAVSGGNDLVRVAIQSRPDVIVSDLNVSAREGFDAGLEQRVRLAVRKMPIGNALDLMLVLRMLGLDVPFVLMGTETKCVTHLLDKGAAAYVHKYDIFGDLEEAVLAAIERRQFVSRSVVHNCKRHQ